MIVRWTRRAETDFLGQCGHIAKDDPELAERLGEEILTSVQSLAEFPYRGRTGRVDGTRELVLAGLPWVAVYAVTDSTVVILRLLHGAQAYPAD